MAHIVPVAERSVEDQRAHYAALKARVFAKPAARQPAPKPVAKDDPVSLYTEVMQIPPPNRALTRAAYLTAMADLPPKDHSVRSVVRVVAAVTGITIVELQSAQRVGEVVKARHIAAYLACRATGKSLKTVGNALGNRDHTTILHSRNKVDKLMSAFGFEWRADLVEMSQKLWDADWTARTAS